MGSAASVGHEFDSETAALTKAEISMLYSHLSQEYSTMTKEIVAGRQYSTVGSVIFRSSPVDGSDRYELIVPGENEAHDIVYEGEEEDDDDDDSSDDENENTNTDQVENQTQGKRSSLQDVFKNVELRMCTLTDSEMEEHREGILYSQPFVHAELLQLAIEESKIAARVNIKALALMGDSKLEKESQMFVNTGTKITPKILKQMGYEGHLIPEKAIKTLGSEELDARMRKAMRFEEEHMKRKAHDKDVAFLNEVLSMKKVSPGMSKIASGKLINSKVVDLMGGVEDETVLKSVKTYISKDMKVSKKAIQMTGDTHLMPAKVKNRRGSEMHLNQIQKMIADNLEQAKLLQKQQNEIRNAILQAGPTNEQLEVGEAMKSKLVRGQTKALRKLGANEHILPDKVLKKLGGEEMSNEQRKKMKQAEKKEQRLCSEV